MKMPTKPTSDSCVNKRVAVVGVATGAFKRYWGAYGTDIDDDADDTYTPGQPARMFSAVQFTAQSLRMTA